MIWSSPWRPVSADWPLTGRWRRFRMLAVQLGGHAKDLLISSLKICKSGRAAFVLFVAVPRGRWQPNEHRRQSIEIC